MRRIQQTSGKAFIRSRKVLDCPWKLTHHSINQCTGRQLSSGKNKISKADHFVDIGLEKALINAFITSADKHNRFFGCSDFTYTRIRQARRFFIPNVKDVYVVEMKPEEKRVVFDWDPAWR